MQKDNEEFVLVLGSKPNSKIPKIKVNKIYCANGAAERGLAYQQYHAHVEKISVVSASEFNKRSNVRDRVIKYDPDLLFCRFGLIDKTIKNKIKNLKRLIELNKFDQLKWQSKFFDYGVLSILYSEMYYQGKFVDKIRYFYDCLRWRGFMGSSTGLFCILLAYLNNPEKNIIVSGIGIKTGGETFYGSNKLRTKRSNLDQKLFFYLKKKIKCKIISTDKEMSEYCNVPLWDGDHL